MKLKLSAMSSIAEVIGAVAIVISLIYVGVQVSDSTRAVRSATASETSGVLAALYTQLGTNQQAIQVYIDGMTNPESLSREEMFQFVVLMHGLLLEYQVIYYLSQEGTLDLELQESLTNTVLGIRDQPGFLVYWGQRKELFKASFSEYIDKMVTTGTTNENMERIFQPRELPQYSGEDRPR